MSKKNIFNANYVGPSGRHLSCLTHTSMFGSYEDDKQESIHSNSGRPSSRGKRRYSEGSICAPRNPNRKGYLAKASKDLDRRRRDHSMVPAKDTAAYKTPGSMNLR